MNDRSDRALGKLAAFHAEVDAEARRLAERHEARLSCRRGCSDCCVDEQAVFELEAERIRRAAPELLAAGEPHPEGACAFLDEQGACRVYEVRPYRCRTEGLPFRWLEERGEDGWVELRDICPLNELEDEPIERLPEEQCWTLGPHEGRLFELARDFGGEPPGRIPLRDLFQRRAPSRAPGEPS